MKQVNIINWYEFLYRLSDLVQYYYCITSEFISLEKNRYAIYKIKPLREIQCKVKNNKIIVRARHGIDVLENVDYDKEACYVLDIQTLQPVEKLFASKDDAVFYVFSALDIK